MLSIKHLKSKGGAGRVARYAEHRKKKSSNKVGYYSSGGAPSFWAGRAAEALGLKGQVERADLVRALEGKPFELDKTPNRKLGIDLTFSAPKSVSITAFAVDDEGRKKIFDAHDRAVREALKYIESEVVTSRKGKGSHIKEKTGNLLAGVYRHEDARSVDGVVDPQIHSHSILINATKRQDGKFGAVELDFGRHAERMHLADHVYKSTLARRLREMGYSLRGTKNGFELESISDQQIEQFSGRRQQIDRGLRDAFGVSREEATAGQRAAANISTRGGKGQLSETEQIKQWGERIREAGVVVSRNPGKTSYQSGTEAADEAIRQAVEHLSERNSVFSHDDLMREAFGFAPPGDVDYTDLLQEIRANGDLIGTGHKYTTYTTREAIEIESEILARARAGREKVLALTDSTGADEFIGRREDQQGYLYSRGQREAVQAALKSEDRYIGIVGAAGAGKSTALAGVTAAFKSKGYEVIGLAPSSAAAGELKDIGANDSMTLASYLMRSKKDSSSKKRKRLVLLDEAGMVSSADMKCLMRTADQNGDRVILIGDPRQFASVEAGSPFEQLLKTSSIKHAKIDEIQRQVDPALREIAYST